MCTQLSADSPLGPQVASSLRYCQLERGKMEGGRKAGRGRRKEGESDAESSGSSAGRRKREERRVWQEETRRRMMETRQDREGGRALERCGGAADKHATRQTMGFIV